MHVIDLACRARRMPVGNGIDQREPTVLAECKPCAPSHQRCSRHEEVSLPNGSVDDARNNVSAAKGHARIAEPGCSHRSVWVVDAHEATLLLFAKLTGAVGRTAKDEGAGSPLVYRPVRLARALLAGPP